MSTANKNNVTIGVPVFNGASLIEQSLQSLCDDQLIKMKMVIYDNASSDETAQICQEFVQKDPRFAYVRNEQNIGAIGNFRKALASCETKYFAWRAYDDFSNPRYFTVLQGLLDENERAVLAAPDILTIKMARSKQRARPFKGGKGPVALLRHSQAAWIYGLFRTEFLQKAHTHVSENYPYLWASDHLVLFHAILREGVVGSGEAVFTQRDAGTGQNACQPQGLSEKKAVMSAYYHYCMTLMDEAELSRGQRTLLQLAVMRHINRRVVRLCKLLL